MLFLFQLRILHRCAAGKEWIRSYHIEKLVHNHLTGTYESIPSPRRIDAVCGTETRRASQATISLAENASTEHNQQQNCCSIKTKPQQKLHQLQQQEEQNQQRQEHQTETAAKPGTPNKTTATETSITRATTKKLTSATPDAGGTVTT